MTRCLAAPCHRENMLRQGSPDLQVGELAINTADKKIYVKDSGNNIIEVANQTTGAATVDDATALAIALG